MVYVCEVYDRFLDTFFLDKRCYRTREDAERRATRLSYSDNNASVQVIELDARGKDGGTDGRLL